MPLTFSFIAAYQQQQVIVADGALEPNHSRSRFDILQLLIIKSTVSAMEKGE
jgi:hypothetical protein